MTHAIDRIAAALLVTSLAAAPSLQAGEAAFSRLEQEVTEHEPKRDLPPAQVPQPKPEGTVWHAHGGPNGADDVRFELVDSGNGRYAFARSDDYRFIITDANGPYYLSRRKSVTRADGSTLVTEFSSQRGELWPLEVGNTVAYDLVVTGDDGRTWEGGYQCTVADQVRLEVAAGAFDTYKIECRSTWNVWIRYYAPRLGTRVRKVHMSRSREGDGLSHDWELVRLETPDQ